MAIEIDLEVLDFRFKYRDTLMWPFIRNALFLKAIYEMFGLANSNEFSNKAYRLIPSYLFFTLNSNPFTKNLNGKNDILFFSSGVVNVKHGHKYINRLYDHFALEYPRKSLIIEDSFRMQYFRPRFFPNVKSLDYISIASLIKSRLKKTVNTDKENIDRFINLIKSRFLYKFKNDVWKGLTLVLEKISVKLPFLYEYYSRLFEIIEPKIMFLEDGSYGSMSYVLKWAVEKGIVTGEFQHGITSLNHPAYNYSQEILGSAYKDYLPQYYLTFGKYWSSAINTSSKDVIIGNPYIIEYVKSLTEKSKINTKRRILFISGGTVYSFIKKLAVGLRKTLPVSEFDIAIRPYPGEIGLVKERYGNLEQDNISLDFGNLYDSLSSYDIIVGVEFSTVLFEAMLFKKKIFVFDGPLFFYNTKDPIFNTFKDAQELSIKIFDRVDNSYDVNYYWDPSPCLNYRNFINTTIGKF
ncbi:MAG: hypothetical protein PHO70_00565 [Candidatus Omnitrophica bacterium]|nr:hypothetical protein [Candidatus Omnitrophota bacterium]